MQDKILTFLFKGYKRRLDSDYDNKVKLYEASVDLKDVLRERLKGIRPGHPDENPSWLNNYILSLDTPERLDFLSKLYAVSNNEAFKKVTEYFMSEAMRKSTLETDNMGEVNYQRANINALMLLEEELDYYAKLYVEEKKAKELMTKEEEFEVI
mgnify:CR=1 FL=1